MENIFDRLQFVKGLNPNKESGVFDTREEAVNYVLGKHIVERPSLLAEPIILLYESEDEEKGPNVILAIGSVGKGTQSQSNRTFFIDTQKTEEEIQDLDERLEAAIRSLTIVPLESDTIQMHSEKTEDGTLLSGDVKIADYRIVDGIVDENIIETEGEKGIYAFVDMEYDPETFVITFRTNKVTKEFQLTPDQHVVRGWYSPKNESIFLELADGSKVEIDVVKLIDEWTVLPDSETPVLLYKEHVSSFTDSHEGVYDWQDVLTADVRVADHIGDNIIHKDRTGRYLYVKGTADNIKYSEGVTVKEAIDRIDTRVSTSEGNLIYKRSDGIYAYAMLDYKQAENKLVYKYTDGNTEDVKTLEFQLNSVKVLEDITYDPVKEVIVIRYIDAQGEYQRVEIPVKDIIEEWDVLNYNHNIELNKFRSEGQGKDILTADVKIHNGDNNILEDKDHTLYVNGIAENIKYDATGETTVKNVLDTLKSEDERIEEKLVDEIARSTAEDEKIETTIGDGFSTDAHETITYKFEQLTDKVNEEADKLQNEIDRSTSKDDEHDIAISGEVAARTADVERIDTTIGSGFSTDAHETITYKFDELQTQVNSEADKLQAEIDRSTSADTIHDGRLDAIDAEIGEGFGPRNTVRDEIENLQSEIDAVSADSSSRLSDVINEDESIDVETRNDAAGKATIKVVKVNLSDEVEDEKPNIIKLNADGLYAGVDLSYVEEANKLIFKTTNGTKEIQLDSMSSIIDIRYDASKEALIITYMTNGHEIKTVEIPLADLIREWKPSENTDGAIKLTLTEAPSGTTGKDILYGEVLISDHEDNILINDGGRLYVSNASITANTAAINALEDRMDTAEADIDALEEGLREETSARTLADEALGARIDQEIEDRTADVNAEETRAISAETALSNKIDTDVLAEKNRAISAETALDTKIDQEIANREDAVLAEKNRAVSAETALDTKIGQEIADRIADVNAEETRATTEEARILHLLEDEISRSTDKDSEHDTKILQNANDILAEIARAEGAENVISGNVIAEETRATTEETAIRTALNTEISNRTTADETLAHSIADEEERRISGDTILQTNIAGEEARAREIETRLETWLNQEIARAEAKEGELNTAITNETIRANAADSELYQKIADVSASSIASDAQLQIKINEEASARTLADNALEDKIDDEITRSTQKDDALTLALQNEIADREQGDADLAEAIREATLSFNDTTSIDFTKSSDNVVTADVKLQEGDNIIKLGQGLYATAHLSYDTGTNKIKLITTAGEEEYQLAGATVIDNLEYDSTNKELVITYHDGNGGVHTVRFGVSELFNEWDVKNPTENSAIELAKTPAATPGGEDKLSGRILLTNLPDNAVQIVNNGLYVSSSAMSESEEIAKCARNELNVLEKVVIGHKISEECGSGYTYEPNNTAAYINSATSFNNADLILDLNLNRVEGKIDDAAISATCIDSKANKIYELLYGEGMTMPSCGEGSHYQPYVGACIISGATSFNEADQMLNDQICEILTMWTSGQTCTSNSDWVEDGANRRIEIDVRLSRGKYAEMSDEDIFIEKLESPLEYIDPTNTEFTDTNVLRIACINEGPSGTTPSVASMQNGIYLSNEWDCGLYYGPSDTEAKSKAEAAGYRTDPYSTDETSGASNYNYNNNVRQTPTP